MISNLLESGNPSVAEQKGASASEEASSARIKPLSWLSTTLIFLNIGLATLFMLGFFWFGSVPTALAYIRGDRLIPDSITKDFGTATIEQRPTVSFSLTNWSDQPIKILGAKPTCSCLVTSDLPVIVPAHGKTILSVSARVKSGSKPFSERLRILTDSGDTNLILSVKGAFH